MVLMMVTAVSRCIRKRCSESSGTGMGSEWTLLRFGHGCAGTGMEFGHGCSGSGMGFGHGALAMGSEYSEY